MQRQRQSKWVLIEVEVTVFPNSVRSTNAESHQTHIAK